MYYTRTVKGLAYKLHCRRAAKSPPGAGGACEEQGAEEVILDENTLAEGKDYCDVHSCEPSPSQGLLAYSVDHVGKECIDELHSLVC